MTPVLKCSTCDGDAVQLFRRKPYCEKCLDEERTLAAPPWCSCGGGSKHSARQGVGNHHPDIPRSEAVYNGSNTDWLDLRALEEAGTY